MKKIVLLLIVFFCVTIIDYSQNAGVKKYTIGDKAQGGIIFWVDDTGQHGLAAALSDQNNGHPIKWCAGKFVCCYAYAHDPRGGVGNTHQIVTIQGNNDLLPYAALICRNLKITQNGITYADWYLPSEEELHLMRLQSNLIGGFKINECYWSSTEYYDKGKKEEISLAWTESIYEDYTIQEEMDKSHECHVRAVRLF